MENFELEPETDTPAFITKKLEKTPKRTPKKKSHWKAKLVLVLILIGLLFGGIAYTFYLADKWFDSHEIHFQTPIKVQTPLTIKKVVKSEPSQIVHEAQAKEIETPTIPAPIVLTDKEVVLKSKHPNTIWAMYGLESSWGKNDKCVRDNKGFNGLGYGQSLKKSNCFESFDQAVAAVDAWLDDHGNMSLAKQLCYYNTGKATSDCKYHQDFKKVYITIK